MSEINRKVPAPYFFILGSICILLALAIGIRSFKQVRHRPLPRPRETNVNLIQDWMTIPYVARTYKVQSSELFVQLGIDSTIPQNHNINLRQIAKDSSTNETVFLDKTKRVVTELQSANPPLP